MKVAQSLGLWPSIFYCKGQLRCYSPVAQGLVEVFPLYNHSLALSSSLDALLLPQPLLVGYPVYGLDWQS